MIERRRKAGARARGRIQEQKRRRAIEQAILQRRVLGDMKEIGLI